MSAQIPSTRKAQYLVKYAGEKVNIDETFQLKEEPMPEVKEGDVLVKLEWAGLEPTMRNSITSRKSYQPPLPLNSVMWCFALGKVVKSNDSDYPVGSLIFSNNFGMADYSIANPKKIKSQQGLFELISEDMQKAFDPREYLSSFGPPGLAAACGLFSKHVGNFRKGDIVLVDGAAGATGQLVIQMAKARGAAKIIGIASSKKKQAVLDAGADAFVGYDEPNFPERLHEVTEDKITLLFENVGGPVFEAALNVMAPHARVAVCGIISEYDTAPYGNKAMRSILINRLHVKGFICMDPENEYNPRDDIIEFLKNGQMKSQFHEFQPGGVENLPKAMLGLFEGHNTGKMVVKL